MRGLGIRRAAVAAGVLVALAAPATAAAAIASIEQRVTVSDGVGLQATLTGEAPLAPRPVVVELSPYGRASGTLDAGPAYNHLLVQVRGTGDSHGRFDAFGPRMQRDVAEVMGWACAQPWSSGDLALNGFSASAIAVYHSLHLELPCLRAAVLKSGTHELYRDLLYPGGVSNAVPGAVVLGGIGAITVAQGLDRDPATAADAFAGDFSTGMDVLRHDTLDGFWRERAFRGDVNRVPVLAIAGFYDVEARGAFEAFSALEADGAHLLVTGAHDRPPAGTGGGLAEARAWLDHHVRGVDTGVEAHPPVQLRLSDGDRRSYVGGRFLRRNASTWPVPGTRWRSFALSPARSGTARSLNDGSLARRAPGAETREAYPAVASFPMMTDVPNAAIVDASGGAAFTAAFPALADMRGAEPLGLSYTSAPLERDLVAAGPASLRVRLATTAPEAAIWAVVSDVGPDGTPHPVATGRLSTDFPRVDPERSRRDARGRVVQPYGRYDLRRPAAPGVARRYRVELWPLGNRFRAGHRVRLHLVGASAASAPGAPGLNVVTTGGPRPSRLLLPALPPAPRP